VLVNRVTTVGVGEAQGLYVGALAVCGIAGPMLGGWVADQFGLGALPLLPLLGAIIAIAITVVAVRPSVRAPGRASGT
jgi:predicted MFS family arabinose efflux permease